jgi:spore germination cell wall hydrolase CwlJ-like protein
MIDAALMCMALTIAHEAGGEPVNGQVAVGYVLYRRAEFDPKNICHETYRPYQFEWTVKPKKYDMQHLRPYLDLAQKILNRKVKDTSRGSTHFHSIALPNQWGKPIKVVINNHIFY